MSYVKAQRPICWPYGTVLQIPSHALTPPPHALDQLAGLQSHMMHVQVSARGPPTSSKAQCTASDSALAALPDLTALVNEVISVSASLDCVVACLPCKGLLMCQINILSVYNYPGCLQ